MAAGKEGLSLGEQRSVHRSDATLRLRALRWRWMRRNDDHTAESKRRARHHPGHLLSLLSVIFSPNHPTALRHGLKVVHEDSDDESNEELLRAFDGSSHDDDSCEKDELEDADTDSANSSDGSSDGSSDVTFDKGLVGGWAGLADWALLS